MTQLSRVTGVATSIRTDSDGTHVRYHNTDVVSFKRKMLGELAGTSVTLRTGGWRTATTKTRMNQAANQFALGFHVVQKDHEWFVVRRSDQSSVPFDSETMTITV